MGTAGWLLVLAVGIALGFCAGRLWPGTSGRLKEIERQRDAAQEDLETYRKNVSAHFETTAELFDKVTADYRGLYEHLAIGARQLGAIKGEAVQSPSLVKPEQRRLTTIKSDPATEPRPAATPTADSVESTESPMTHDEAAPEPVETGAIDEGATPEPKATALPSAEADEAWKEQPEAAPEVGINAEPDETARDHAERDAGDERANGETGR